MRSSGITLNELHLLLDSLKQSKVNNGLQILIDNEMCKCLEDAIECLLKERDMYKNRNINALNFVKEFKYYIPEDDKPELISILEGGK